MNRKNAFGFSIVELLIVVGMLGGVSLVVMNIGKLSKKSSVKLQLDTDITLTTNEINGILSDPVKCLATLGTTTAPSNINGKFFTQGSGSAPTTGYSNSGFRVISYTLSGIAPNGVLTILFENKNILKETSGTGSISKKLNLYIEGTPGAITHCRSVSTGISDIWVRGTGNDISYNAGNIGIGTTASSTRVAIDGTVSFPPDYSANSVGYTNVTNGQMLTVTKSFIKLIGATGAVTLGGLNPGVDGQLVILLGVNGNNTVTLPIGGSTNVNGSNASGGCNSDGVGCGAPYVISGNDAVILVFNAASGSWVEVGRTTHVSKLQVDGPLSLGVDYSSNASGYTVISNGQMLTANKSFIKLTGNNGPVTMGGLNAGIDGQVVTFVGMNASYRVIVPSGGSSNIKLSGGAAFNISDGDTLTLIYNASWPAWVETSRMIYINH